MESDSPAIAEAIVVHAEKLAEREDHIWDIISRLMVPVEHLTDSREQSKVDYHTEPLVRAFLYQKVKGFSQNQLADRLENRPILVKTCGFDVQKLGEAPGQGTINHAWHKFSDGTKLIIEAVATGIARVAVEKSVIAESLVATDPADDEDTEESKQEAHRQKTTKTVKLAAKHAFPEF